MKKLLFISVSFFSFFCISCQNDDIVITKIDPKHNVTLNISTQDMYDEFNITNRIRDEYLRDGGRVIGITTYAYDASGNLVDSMATYQNNYNTVVQTFKDFVEGSYTFVTIETLLNPDENYKADDWTFDDTRELSNLKITQVYPTVFYGDVLGVVTTDVQLKNENTSLNITPKAIGSLVNYHPYDFEESDFIKFGFVTNDILEYYSLNPLLQRKDRYHEDLTKKNYVNVRFLADVEESTGYYYTFYLLESSIEWKNGAQDETQSKNGTLSTWSSEQVNLEDGKTYSAGCYYLYSDEESVYAASYFGDYEGYLNWAKEWKQWKENFLKQTIYTVPYTNWSVGTVSAVKSYMNGFTLVQDIEYDETYKNYTLVYFDTSDDTMYEYDFTSSTKGLTDAYVYLDGDKYTISQVRDEVEKEGYTYNSQNNGNYYYTGKSAYVTIYQSSSGTILVNYYDPKAYNNSPKREMPSYNVDKKRNMLLLVSRPFAIKSNLDKKAFRLETHANRNLNLSPTN